MYALKECRNFIDNVSEITSGRTSNSSYRNLLVFISIINLLLVALFIEFFRFQEESYVKYFLELILAVASPFYLFMSWIHLFESIRRLHDMNLSGRWVWLAFVPIINLMLLKKGTSGENNYGEESYQLLSEITLQEEQEKIVTQRFSLQRIAPYGVLLVLVLFLTLRISTFYQSHILATDHDVITSDTLVKNVTPPVKESLNLFQDNKQMLAGVKNIADRHQAKNDQLDQLLQELPDPEKAIKQEQEITVEPNTMAKTTTAEKYERVCHFRDFNACKSQAARGVAQAQYYLGVMYYKGENVHQDFSKAIQWFNKSAKNNYIEAYLYLGNIYNSGTQGVDQDYKKAAVFYRTAAKKNNVEAQYHLGELYNLGHGVPQDFTEAIKWFGQAAERKHPKACFQLAQKYALGEGTPRDYTKAHMYWSIASAFNVKSAAQNRDLLAKKMSPSELEKAQKMAKQWRHKKKMFHLRFNKGNAMGS